MPAQIHDVLLEHGLISDPNASENAADAARVGGKDWAYACHFKTPAGIAGLAFLHFGGLDTLAAAYLNGAHLGDFSNMFREFRVEAAKYLAPAGGGREKRHADSEGSGGPRIDTGARRRAARSRRAPWI